MLDIDAIITGKPGSPRLSDLLSMAEKGHEDSAQSGMDSKVVSHLEMQTSKDGVQNIKSTVPNLLIIMEKDKRWKKKVWLNEFSNAIYLDEKPLKDTDYTRIKRWMFKQYGVHFSTEIIVEATNYVAEINGHNPLTSWLNKSVWDGVPRMDEWLVRACGGEDNKLNREIGRRWLIQCIARAMEPGCKADCVLILVGPQGARKSTTFRILGSPEYFCDTPMDIGSSNAYMQIHRAWIYEVAELDSIRRARNSSTKAFLSAQEDTFRLPYARQTVTLKRHTVFCGTTNKAEFITDETGSRRYWPIQVGKMDTDWTEHNRSQLWSEAVVAYKNGEKWYLENETQEELNKQSSDFRQFDPWHEIVERYIRANGLNMSTTDLMEQGLKLEKYQMTRASEMRVGDIMRQLGFDRVRKRVFGDRKYVWVEANKDNVIEIQKPKVVVDNEDGRGI
jgi:predicted P-loop ATPase|tara:strand:+ start:2290 stop:3630 length:1341 start_codon:yes stop_codon:yes gene_type:complete